MTASPTQIVARRPLTRGFVIGALLLGAVVGCTAPGSATDLQTVGPPMIEQVRLNEAVTDPVTGNVTQVRIFDFGTHPQAGSADEPPPASVKVAATTQSFRVIMDELLVGNYLEQIECTTTISQIDGAFSNVPVGDTPDDIARCAVSPDLLPETCTGPKAVCVCDLDAGCGTFTKGESVGVLDENLDGAADVQRLTPGSVRIVCGSIEAPVDSSASYWNPSGDQLVPAMGGFDALGPAIVLVPAEVATAKVAALPSNATCGLKFNADVVDKTNISVCAPPGGDITKGCTPGDTSAFQFTTEPLVLTVENPAPGFQLMRTDPIVVDTSDSIPLDPNSLGGIQLLEGNTPYTQFVVSLDANSGSFFTITSTNATGFDPSTQYTLIVPTTVTDTFGQAISAPLMATFTTGP